MSKDCSSEQYRLFSDLLQTSIQVSIRYKLYVAGAPPNSALLILPLPFWYNKVRLFTLLCLAKSIIALGYNRLRCPTFHSLCGLEFGV